MHMSIDILTDTNPKIVFLRGGTFVGFCGFVLITVASLGIEKDFQNVVFYFYYYYLFI